MPLPDYISLFQRPANLLTWLDDNILCAGTLTNAVNPGGVNLLHVQTRMFHNGLGCTGTNAAGNAVGVYNLTSTGAAVPHVMRSHVCNYTANTATSVDLDNTADFVFTTNMNGCTFAVGQPQANGTTRVTHANRGGHIADQRAQVRAEHGLTGPGMGGVTLLEPNVYRDGDGAAAGQGRQTTVFGIRNGTTWDFYYQSYNYLGNAQFQLNGVHPF